MMAALLAGYTLRKEELGHTRSALLGGTIDRNGHLGTSTSPQVEVRPLLWPVQGQLVKGLPYSKTENLQASMSR
ncbi:hypothetical protein E2C01_074179 [Portunus trituberculatus]|uniref:Uncharacterized protein n=1 Tax=Portunus trituberculatus TaxID=210409 RepID=A0A5B7I7D4_PORTR|nr:hypothetical protein [Portunus trituberculatus]